MGNNKPIGVAYSDPELADFTATFGAITTLSATAGTIGALTATSVTATTLTVAGTTISASATMTPGAGFAGTGTVYKSSVQKEGDVIVTRIVIDLTGAASSTTDLDIIGTSGVSHIGQITAAKNGTNVAGRMTCLELPAGGVTDIDLYSATEGTGAFDGGIAALAETALVTSGGAWATGTTKGFLAEPAADSYLYLCGGDGGTANTYTAGKFLIELFGY